MHTRSYGNEYTVVITPWPRPRIEEVRHAYLYYLLDPLATRNEEVLKRKKPLSDHALRAQLLGDAYKQDFLLLLTTGSLVRAVEARMDHKPDQVQQALARGLHSGALFLRSAGGLRKTGTVDDAVLHHHGAEPSICIKRTSACATW
jgi:hypothetical protein